MFNKNNNDCGTTNILKATLPDITIQTRSNRRRREKIKLSFYFHTSLCCLMMF